jgi:hypothetical protein
MRTVGSHPRLRVQLGFAWLAVTVVLLLSLAPARNGPGSPDDEGLLLVYPEQVMSGAVAYRDFEDFYGPGNDWTLAAAYSVLGPKVGVERGIGLVYRILIVTGVFALAAFDGVAIAVVAGLLSTAVFSYMDMTWWAFAWLGGVVFGLSSLWAYLHGLAGSCRRPRKWLVAAGALAGGAVLFRFDLFPAVALSAAALLIGEPKLRRRSYMLGLLLPLAGLAVHVARAGVGPMFSSVIVGGVLRSGHQAGLPLPRVWSTPWVELMLLLAGTAVLCLAVLAARVRGAPALAQRRTAALALFALGLLPAALQRPDRTHFMFAACVTLGVAPIALVELVKSMPRRSLRAAMSAAVIALLALFGLELDGRHILQARNQPAAWIAHRGRLFPVATPALAATVDTLLAAVERHSTPGQRLFVGPANLRRTFFNDIYIYHLLPQLKPATYYLDMNPGTANRRGSRLATDIASADILVLTTEYDAVWQEMMPFSHLGSNEPCKVVSDDFALQGRYGPFLLYVRRVLSGATARLAPKMSAAKASSHEGCADTLAGAAEQPGGA